MKAYLNKAVKAAGVVIHDPTVDRAAKSFAVLIAVRVLIALGASAEVVQLVEKLVG